MLDRLDSFKNAFSGYEDYYTVIGGTACELLMNDLGMGFRVTKDVDMIVILESGYGDFLKTFWQFITGNDYVCCEKEGQTHFYRFKTERADCPSTIEIFSRAADDDIVIPGDIMRVQGDEEVSGLSAIVLNDDYYEFMKAGRKMVEGINILDAEHLIPFKAFAWMDNKRRKEEGEEIHSRDIVKHKNDVFRLLQIADNKIDLEETIRKDMMSFADEVAKEEIDVTKLSFDSKEEAIQKLRELYLII